MLLAGLATAGATLAQPECIARPASAPCRAEGVAVKGGDTLVLPAGAYGDTKVRNGATLVLQQGAYEFCGLHVSRGGSLRFAGPATIVVAGDVRFGNAAVVGPALGASISPCDVEWAVHGARVVIQRHADVRLALCAPKASLRVNKGANLVGTFVAAEEHVRRATIQPCASTTTSTTTTTMPGTTCGNAVRDLPEACDDGNADPGDGCRPDCTPTPCAEGIRDPHASCPIGGGACDVLPPTCPATPAACTITGEEVHDVIAFLADDAQEGRDNLTPASLRVQEHLVSRLQTFAVGGAADGGFRQPFAQGTNLLARLPGRDPSQRETVVVGAHYDHLGAFGAAVYNGATDNAGGTAAVLAVGRALARLPVPPARPVVLALWDAEEDGLLGSEHYVADPAVPIGDTIAYVNLDIVGSSPVQGFRRETFAVGLDTSPAFPALLADVTAGDPLAVGGLSAIFGQGRSDYAPFLAASVPVLFFSDTTGGCYHTPGDDLATVHVGKALRTAWIAFRLVTALADADARPAFTAEQPIPTFADAVTLEAALVRGLCNAAASGLAPADIARVEGWVAQLEAIVSAGPGAFRPPDAVAVGFLALDAISLLTSLPCQAN
jgi:cysteine-rich repeat protein